MSTLLALLVFSLAAAVRTQEDVLCAVTNPYDFQYGIANVQDCSVLELQNSVQLTATAFATALTIADESLTIRPSPTAGPEVVLDFGDYELNSKILVTGSSVVSFDNITLQNYAATSVQNGTTSTFMALFQFDSTATLFLSNVHFLVDAGRCLLDPNYANELAASRLAWSALLAALFCLSMSRLCFQHVCCNGCTVILCCC